MIIEIGKTLISSDIIEEKFVCDLQACKGNCCVEGDSGAPLEDEEIEILKEIYPIVKPYMTPEGIAVVEEQGVSVVDFEGDNVTPTLGTEECVFFCRKNGITYCAIEKAYMDGKINFPKPISCHLYPIRIKKYQNFDGLNYDRQDMCKAACVLGEKLQVPVYQFLKEPLIRHYGEEWYAELDDAAKAYNNELNKNQ